MSIASINETVLMYTAEKNHLTASLAAIMGKITEATAGTSEILEETIDKRADLNDKVKDDPDFADTTEYATERDAIEDEYRLKLADINAWESELEQEKSFTETKLKAVTSFEESFTSVLKSNVKKDFTYGQN